MNLTDTQIVALLLAATALCAVLALNFPACALCAGVWGAFAWSEWGK
jgi:hypothetical protein